MDHKSHATESRATHGTMQGEAALIRAVGTFALTAAVINVIVGAIAIIPIALCFSAVGSRVLATGGPYSYLTATFGQFAGFIGGALMWISNITSSAGVAAALSEQVANLVPAFAPPIPRALLITGVYAALFSLNAFGVKLGARAIVALAALKLTPLFLLAALGIWFVDWNQVSFSVGDVPSWSALGASMALVMFAYSGMETALVPSGELRDPSRNVPRATVAAILLVVLLYLGLQIVGQGVLGSGLGRSTVPVADTAAALWAPARVLLLVTACLSMAGFMMGNLLGTSRLVYALGRDGYLPRVFGRVTPTHRVPMNALIAHAIPAWVLAIAGSFDTLALISGGAICLVYGLVSIAAWRAQRADMRERGDAPFVLPGGPAIPALAVGAMVLIVTQLTRKEWYAILIALAVLIAVYAGLTLARRRA